MKKKTTFSIDFGPMFSGKSQELYRKCARIADALAVASKESNFNGTKDIVLIIVYKSQSTRAAESNQCGFTTHSSNFTPSHNLKIKEVECLSEITDEEIQHIKYIGIDEAFYPDLYEKALEWFLKGISISIACIDGSATQQILCPQIMKLLPYATDITKHKAYCHYCLLEGSEEYAYYTIKIDSSIKGDKNTEIDLGGSDKYHPACLHHLLEKRK